MPTNDADAKLVGDLLPRRTVEQVWSGYEEGKDGRSVSDGTLTCLFVLTKEQPQDRETELFEYATYVADSLKGRLGYPEDLPLDIQWSDN